MENENIEAVAESAAEAESFNDEEFLSGLFDGETFVEEEEENLFDEEKTEEKEAKPEAQEEKEAESEEKPEEAASVPEELSFVEHGKTFSVPKEAAESLATALGISSAQLIDIYQKGCAFDTQKAKLEAAQNDTAVIEALAGMRGMKADDLRAEINSQIAKIPLDRALEQVKAEYPEISENAAAELARLRVEAEKPKAEEPKQQEENTEEDAARLREVDMFIARHKAEGIEMLPNEVIEAWKKTNISLEEAFGNFKLKTRNEELEKEIAALKKEKAKDDQKEYAKEHSSGSSSSAAGKFRDEFVEGLFAEY